ncbi:putative phosphate transport regulator [Syntrophobacter sp. SbD1]|nr:putative phosphate transport regulator [Syntrophobacter sp. SbD1]
MSFSLFPKSPKFFELFRDQNRIIVNAATVLNKMAQEFVNCEDLCQVINMLEAEGDAINRTIRRELSTTFITPIDREDIHEINSSQETILNHIQAVSNRVGVYEVLQIRFPAKRMIANIMEMVTGTGVMLGRLGKGREVSDTVRHVKQLKKECEMLLLSGLGELYDIPSPGPADVLDIIKWTQIYDRIDKLFNRTWQLTKSIEGIVLKNA